MLTRTQKTVVMFSLLAFVVCMQGSLAGAGKSWTQRLGPNQDGISQETEWLKQWPAGGPKVDWEKQLGEGYAAVSISDGLLYTMGHANGKDTVWCLNADTGKEVWSHSYPCKKGGYPGPRATPTIDRTLVYTISREGNIFCFQAKTGKIVWQKKTADMGYKAREWGFAGSAMILGKLVIFNVGEWGMAFDKLTGRLIWKSANVKCGFSTPFVFNFKGKVCVAVFAAKALVLVDPRNGKKLWSLTWETRYDVNAATPILVDKDLMFISSNYDRGCALVRLGKGIVWENKNMRNHFNKCVLHKGYLYGFDVTTLTCIDVKTGKKMWAKRSGRSKSGSLILADDHLIALSDTGNLAVLPASPEGYNPTAQAKVLNGLCWTQPVLLDGRLYCRDKEGTLKCLNISGK